MDKGKFFVFEGIDGSGKSVQTALLTKHLTQEKYKVETFDFPQYGKKSAGLVEEYLSGKYGKASQVDPYIASTFYAVDRYDLSLHLKELLRNGQIVVTDRYIGSNIGHQGAKIHSEKKRAEFFAWLYEFEYGIFKIPKPTVSFFLHVSADMAQKLSNDPERRQKKKSDIHEKDISHLKNAEKAYLQAAKLFPKNFITIECVEKDKLLSPKTIHERIWTKVQKFLY